MVHATHSSPASASCWVVIAQGDVIIQRTDHVLHLCVLAGTHLVSTGSSSAVAFDCAS
jgi:hypothetical protein